MGLIAVDKLNRKVLGYLCRNGNILMYCCVECDVEFEEANQLEIHMSKHELRPQQSQTQPEQQRQQQQQQQFRPHVEGSSDHQTEQQQQQQQQQQEPGQELEQQPNENVPNETEGMEADTTNETNSDIDIPLTPHEIESRLRLEHDLKECSVKLFRFDYDIDDLKSDSDDISFQSTSAGEEDEEEEEEEEKSNERLDEEKPNQTAKTLRKRIKAPAQRIVVGPRKKLYECEHCSLKFAHAGHFRRHFNTAHPVEKPLVCYLCGCKFVTNDELTDHHQHHQPDSTKTPVFPCNICGKNVENLKRHLRDHELDAAYEAAMAANVGDTSIEEPIDDIKYEARQSFDENGLQTIELEVEYAVTSDFNVSTTTNSNMENGIVDNSMDMKPPAPVTNPEPKVERTINGNVFRCTLCPRRFRLEILLAQHMQRHEQKKAKVPCPVCTRMVTKNYKRAHLLRFHRPIVVMAKEIAAVQSDAQHQQTNEEFI